MLIELYGRNFGCFRDEFCLSLLATDIDPGSARGIAEIRVDGDEEPLRLLRSVAIYGPNASGKSTVLRAANAIRHLIEETRSSSSDRKLGFFLPFALDDSMRSPVKLGVKAVIDSAVYDYSFAFTLDAFVEESLERLEPAGGRHVLFRRSGQSVSGAWTEHPQFALVVQEFRPNALLLSLADSLVPGLAKSIAIGITRLLWHSEPETFLLPFRQPASEAARRVHDEPGFAEWLQSRLASADVGVVDVRTEPLEPKSRASTREEAFLVQALSQEEKFAADRNERSTERPPRRLVLLHGSKAGPASLPYGRESLGTRRLVEWSPMLYDLVHGASPRAAFVDEFDGSMHPQLLRAMVQQVNAPRASAHGQLVFTTHETSLLDDEAKDAVLRRDQVYFTEKDASGAARLYSLAEFRERNNLNIRRRYLQGRYGALPSLGVPAE